MDAPPRSAEERPEFMKLLGLLPPYCQEDIHKAYRDRAVIMHPDRGGSPQDFLQLQDAYQQAQQYIERSLLNRDWLARHVEPYIRQQELIDEIHRRRGEVRVEKVGWAQDSLGDYATLLERICGLDLSQMSDADGMLKFLSAYRLDLQCVTEIDLSGSDLTDIGLAQIAAMQILRLKRLNLARTQVSAQALKSVRISPYLDWLNLGGIRTGWLNRLALRRNYPKAAIHYS
jgi:hypothetical protein